MFFAMKCEAQPFHSQIIPFLPNYTLLFYKGLSDSQYIKVCIKYVETEEVCCFYNGELQATKPNSLLNILIEKSRNMGTGLSISQIELLALCCLPKSMDSAQAQIYLKNPFWKEIFDLILVHHVMTD
jgi:hypothetical protein